MSFREVYALVDAEKGTVELLTAIISLLLILLLAWVANSIVKVLSWAWLFLGQKIQDSDRGAFSQREILHRLSHLAPAFVISALSPVILGPFRFSGNYRGLGKPLPCCHCIMEHRRSDQCLAR